MAVSQVCREPEKSLANHKTSLEGVWFRRHRVNGRERGTEAGGVFLKNLCMESNAGDLTAEELKDWHKQDKNNGKQIITALCMCVRTLNLKHLLLFGIDATS